MTFNNRVSVLVLTHNHENYIRDCIDSILKSSLINFHIWVIDDGSTDKTCDIIEDISSKNDHITLIKQIYNGGRSSISSQRLVDDSHGYFLVLMSGDDFFGAADGLQRAVDALESDPDLDLVIPRMVYLMEDPTREAPACHAPDLLAALRSESATSVYDRHLSRSVSRIFLQGMVLRRSAVEAFGGFDTDLMSDDYAFVMRLFGYLCTTGRRFRFDEQAIWFYRVHENNAHRNPVRQFIIISEVVKTYIDEDRWAYFEWDAVVCSEIEQFNAIVQNAHHRFGQSICRRAIEPSLIATVKHSVRQRNLPMLCKIQVGKGLSFKQRGLVALYLMKLLLKCFVGIWRN